MSQNPGQHKILPICDQRIVTWLGRIWSHKKEREPEPPTFGSFETNKSWSSFLCLFVSGFRELSFIFSLPDKLTSPLSTCRDRRRRHSVSLEEKPPTSPDHEETREMARVIILHILPFNRLNWLNCLNFTSFLYFVGFQSCLVKFFCWAL